MADHRLRFKDNAWRRHVFKDVCVVSGVVKPGSRPASRPGSDLGQTRYPGSTLPWTNLGPALEHKKLAVEYSTSQARSR